MLNGIFSQKNGTNFVRYSKPDLSIQPRNYYSFSGVLN